MPHVSPESFQVAPVPARAGSKLLWQTRAQPSLLAPWNNRHSLCLPCSSSPSRTSNGAALLATEIRSRGMESLQHSSEMAARMAQYLVQRSKFWFRQTWTMVYPVGTGTLCSNAQARSQPLTPCNLQPRSRVQLSDGLWAWASNNWNLAFSSVSVTSTRPETPGVQCSGAVSGTMAESLRPPRTTEDWKSLRLLLSLSSQLSVGARN
mmetsp:Transcript_41974/g.125599  ORF Transcript_41974/g.125599 Transcript_41974/m.125599 type:complete len:207 (+) Transcript_41974:380-1000(+)